jgi:predicted aminopeptidase
LLPAYVMNEKRKYIPLIVIAAFIALLILFCVFNFYLVKQGFYIIIDNLGAGKIDSILERKDIEKSEREFLATTKEIKRFAVEKIGLKNDNNYTTYIKIGKDYLVDVVSACDKVSFKQYEWQYPFFGGFPYKGFFERRDAEAEARSLKEKNLDTIIRKVDAFSTLGFFTDPVYSFMKRYSDDELASLVIHEQTHATIFLKDKIQFNEELASFIGQQGSLLYIAAKYGKDSAQYREAESSGVRSRGFTGLIGTLRRDLESLYKLSLPRKQTLEIRGLIIHEFKERYRTDYLHDITGKGFGQVAALPVNNAFVMLFMEYEQDLSLYAELFEAFGSDLKAMMKFVSGLKDIKEDPKQYISNYLDKNRASLNRSVSGAFDN